MPPSTSEPGAQASRLFGAYVFDMDGTIYLGDELLPGAKRLVTALRSRDLPVRFLSNNPTKDPSQYAEKLDRLGLPTPVDDIVNTVVATTTWLTTHHPDAVVYPIAEQPLVDALDAAGVEMSDDPERIDVVLASYDRTFTYAKLQIAFDAIWFHGRAILVGTNPDRYCPMPGGRGEPDCAAVLAAVEACTGVERTAVVGKPATAMLEASLSGLGVDPPNAVMVGDRLSTDIEMAHAGGTASALVLTGEASRADLDDLDRLPDLVLDRVDRLVPRDVWDAEGWDEAA